MLKENFYIEENKIEYSERKTLSMLVDEFKVPHNSRGDQDNCFVFSKKNSLTKNAIDILIQVSMSNQEQKKNILKEKEIIYRREKSTEKK